MFLNLANKKSLFDSTLSLSLSLFFQVYLFPFNVNLLTSEPAKFKGHSIAGLRAVRPDITLSIYRKFVQAFKITIPAGQ